jgi:hypothetical protein
MDENLKDQDILLVREKGSSELKVANMDKDGKVKQAKSHRSFSAFTPLHSPFFSMSSRRPVLEYPSFPVQQNRAIKRSALSIPCGLPVHNLIPHIFFDVDLGFLPVRLLILPKDQTDLFSIYLN